MNEHPSASGNTFEYFIVNDGGFAPLELGDVEIYASRRAGEIYREIYDADDPRIHVFTPSGLVYKILPSSDGRRAEFIPTEMRISQADVKDALLRYFSRIEVFGDKARAMEEVPTGDRFDLLLKTFAIHEPELSGRNGSKRGKA